MKKNDIILSVKNLTTCFKTTKGVVAVSDGVSFDLTKGKTLAIVGESGCGKTVTALSILRLIPEISGFIKSGEVLFNGRDISRLPSRDIRKVRGNRIAMIFQEPMTSLNPVMTIGDQIAEGIILHLGLSKREALKKAVDILDQVRMPDPERHIYEYPHQLSGGMKQRVMIAMALSCEPDVLIADEPTTALDVTVQNQILKLLNDLQEKKGTAILLITHDIGVVYETADYICVMYAGKIVEEAPRDLFFKSASHPYTTKLFESLPGIYKRGGKLASIPGHVPDPANYPPGCRFADRCHLVFERCRIEEPLLSPISEGHSISCHLGKDAPKVDVDIKTGDRVQLSGGMKNLPTGSSAPCPLTTAPYKKPLLSISGLKVHFPIKKGFFKKTVGFVKAVDGIDISVAEGETVALVGESGCGKTSAGKGILRLTDITEGKIAFKDTDILNLSGSALRAIRKDMQIMFQDPYSSLNPRMMVNQIISEGLTIHNIGETRREREDIVKGLLSKVGLNPDMLYRYPHEFSGGQRQRIGIARFLAVQPKFVVCDEVTSSLDVSVQAQILNLLKKLQTEEGLSYLFITHNLSVVSYIADRVLVMYLGRVVEDSPVQELFNAPKHPYTNALMLSFPQIGVERDKQFYIEGDIPSPANPPRGCHFHPRCPKVMPRCREEYPPQTHISDIHTVKCWLYE